MQRRAAEIAREGKPRCYREPSRVGFARSVAKLGSEWSDAWIIDWSWCRALGADGLDPGQGDWETLA